jgi:hypothetical protein
MRSRLRSLSLLAAASVIALAPGAAPAQQLSRPNYYTPSNYGNGPSRPSYYMPSNYGNALTRGSYGMPNIPNPYGQGYNGTIGPATPVPVGQLSAVGRDFALSGPGGTPLPTPVTGPAPTPPVGTLAPGTIPVPAEEVPAEGTPAAPPAGTAEAPPAGTPGAEALAPTITASALGTVAVPPSGIAGAAAPYALPTKPRPSYYEGYSGGASLAPAYGSRYSGPQYQSSFYEPLRRVFGSQGY